MLRKALKTLMLPRNWLLASAACLGVWLALGYHQDQVAAQLALESKAGTGPANSAAGPDLSGWRQVSLAAALFFALLTGLCKARGCYHTRRPGVQQNAATEARSTAQTAFQPIMAQEDIAGNERTGEPSHRFENSPSRKASQFMQTAVASLTPVRNRQ